MIESHMKARLLIVYLVSIQASPPGSPTALDGEAAATLSLWVAAARLTALSSALLAPATPSASHPRCDEERANALWRTPTRPDPRIRPCAGYARPSPIRR